MNAEQITAARKRAQSSADLMLLIQQVDPRQAEIRARIAALAAPLDTTRFPNPPERLAALRAGPEAVKALDDEIQALQRESEFLAFTQAELYRDHEAMQIDEARRAVPAAVKRLPGALRNVREAMEAFDAAVAVLNTTLEQLGRYADGGLPLPLTDEQQTEILRLREETWRARDLRVLYHDDRLRFPKSWRLLHATHAEMGAEAAAYHIRRPPSFEAWPDGEPVLSGSAGRW